VQIRGSVNLAALCHVQISVLMNAWFSARHAILYAVSGLHDQLDQYLLQLRNIGHYVNANLATHSQLIIYNIIIYNTIDNCKLLKVTQIGKKKPVIQASGSINLF
jgi:hypothetical protein